MADITPDIPAGRQIVEAYGGGGFRVSGVAWKGSILIFPDRVAPWPVAAADAITPDSLAEIAGADPAIEILLLGCGASFLPAPDDVRARLRQAGIVVEAMDTGAACRTYNVLLAEDRRVAAALIALA